MDNYLFNLRVYSVKFKIYLFWNLYGFFFSLFLFLMYLKIDLSNIKLSLIFNKMIFDNFYLFVCINLILKYLFE